MKALKIVAITIMIFFMIALILNYLPSPYTPSQKTVFLNGKNDSVLEINYHDRCHFPYISKGLFSMQGNWDLKGETAQMVCANPQFDFLEIVPIVNRPQSVYFAENRAADGSKLVSDDGRFKIYHDRNNDKIIVFIAEDGHQVYARHRLENPVGFFIYRPLDDNFDLEYGMDYRGPYSGIGLDLLVADDKKLLAFVQSITKRTK
jgi:hypothetical protein